MKKTNLFSAVIAIVMLTTSSLITSPNMDNNPEGEPEAKKEKIVSTVDSDSIINSNWEEVEEEDQSSIPIPDDNDLDPTNVENKLELKGISVSPNPSYGLIKLEVVSGLKNPLMINIFSTNGKKVYSDTMRNFEGEYSKRINLSMEKSGIYFVSIMQGKEQISKKLILR